MTPRAVEDQHLHISSLLPCSATAFPPPRRCPPPPSDSLRTPPSPGARRDPAEPGHREPRGFPCPAAAGGGRRGGAGGGGGWGRCLIAWSRLAAPSRAEPGRAEPVLTLDSASPPHRHGECPPGALPTSPRSSTRSPAAPSRGCRRSRRLPGSSGTPLPAFRAPPAQIRGGRQRAPCSEMEERGGGSWGGSDGQPPCTGLPGELPCSPRPVPYPAPGRCGFRYFEVRLSALHKAIIPGGALIEAPALVTQSVAKRLLFFSM